MPFSPNIIGVIKSRRMRWVVHVAHMKEKQCICRSVGGVGEELGVYGVILKRISKRNTGCDGVDLILQVQDRATRLLWTRLWAFNFIE